MRRFFTVLACLLVVTPGLAAQAQSPAPVEKAKYVKPVKGTATIEVLDLGSRRVGKEMVTRIKVRNTSEGAINLLRVNEYWYDAKPAIVTGTEYRHKKAPINPGDVVEITLRSPVQGAPQRTQVLFTHANGDVKATTVKAFK